MVDADDKSDEISFEDSENYNSGGGQGLTIREITLRQFNRAMLEGSREMTSSGVRRRYVNGEYIEVAVPNQKEIFINCTDMAYMPLRPYALENREPKVVKRFKEYEEETEKLDLWLKESYDKLEKKYENKFNGNVNGIDYYSMYNEEVNKIKNTYENKRVILAKNLLVALSFLLKEIGYFSEEGATGIGGE